MKYIFTFLIFSILINIAAYSAELRGIIKNSATQEILPGARVQVYGTSLGAYADRAGRFTINNVKEGENIIIASLIGYSTERIAVRVTSSGTTDVEILLREQPLQTAEIVVSANKRVQAVQDVPISVSVIDNRLLNNLAITSLEKALEFVPGVEVNQDNISIRGSSGFAFGVGSRAALLLDGFPMLSADNGDIKADALPFFDVERIEVVKGAGSALYGTGAIGGVINIITANPSPTPQFKIRGYTGIYTKPRHKSWEYSDNEHISSGLDLSYSRQIAEKFGMLLSSGFYSDESYRAYDDETRFTTFAKFNYKISNKSDITLHTNVSYSDATDWLFWNSLDSATRPPTNTDLSRRTYSGKYTVFLGYNHIISDNTFFNFKTGLFATSYQNSLNRSNSEFRQSDGYSYNSELQLNSLINQKLMTTFGLNYLSNQVKSFSFGDNSQNIISAYLQGEYSGIRALIITVGGRFDYEKANTLDGAWQISPKAGLNYSVSEDFVLRASAGAGFRAPTSAERYATINFQGFNVEPNEKLKAERSISFEVGGTYKLNIGKTPIYLDFAIFQNRMYDLIEAEFSSVNAAVIVFDNVTRANITGFELGVKSLLFGMFGVESSVTYFDPQDLTTNRTLMFRSNWLWLNRLTVPLGIVELQGDYRYKSRHKTVDPRLGLQIKNYDARVDMHIVDARVILKLSEISALPINLIVSARNLLDYYYTEVSGNLGTTRFISLQFEANF